MERPHFADDTSADLRPPYRPRGVARISFLYYTIIIIILKELYELLCDPLVRCVCMPVYVCLGSGKTLSLETMGYALLHTSSMDDGGPLSYFFS